jgi:hypothetical protein
MVNEQFQTLDLQIDHLLVEKFIKLFLKKPLIIHEKNEISSQKIVIMINIFPLYFKSHLSLSCSQ